MERDCIICGEHFVWTPASACPAPEFCSPACFTESCRREHEAEERLDAAGTEEEREAVVLEIEREERVRKSKRLSAMIGGQHGH